MQDKSMILDNLAFQRVELERFQTKVGAIEAEIFRLEKELHHMGESLNNPRACLNPIAFAAKKCEECGYNGPCSYVSKGDYGRFRL